MSDDALDLLRRALDQTGTLIARIAPEQHDAPTPCEGWDVKTLVGHVIGGLDAMTATARGEQPDWAGARGAVEGDWEPIYRGKSGDLLAAWQSADPETLQRTSQQIAEEAVHGWDIATATGQATTTLDSGVGEHALAWARAMLKPEYRGPGGGGAFGDEVPVPDDAPVYDRLAGWFGRDPAWQPG